jgi:hypothetical protein
LLISSVIIGIIVSNFEKSIVGLSFDRLNNGEYTLFHKISFGRYEVRACVVAPVLSTTPLLLK